MILQISLTLPRINVSLKKTSRYIALLEKEIQQLEINIGRAFRRTGVTQEEIRNIESKIRIKRELLAAVSGRKRCAVFTTMHATDYEPSPKWVQYCSWMRDVDALRERLAAAQENPRFAEVKVVAEVKMYFDLEGFDVEESGV